MDMRNVSRIFQTFMTRVVTLEDMAKLGGQNLAVFQQELEIFRRGPLTNSMLAQVLASNPSERLKAYQEAGYRHCHTDHAVIVKSRAVMDEIQRLLDEANGMMHEDLNTRLGNIGWTEGEPVDRVDTGAHERAISPKTKVRQLITPDYVTTMAVICSMLQQDFTMQERVVGTLGLDSASELLQNYHMMWTLRPFVDESVMEEALSWTRPY